MTREISNHIRLATVTDVDHDAGIAYVRWLDQGTDGPQIPISHPYAGRSGEGIFVGLQPGSVVALGMSSYERYIPVAVIPTPAYYGGDMLGVAEASFDAVGFPQIDDGDIVLQGVGGGQFRLNGDGTVALATAFGEGTTYGGDPDDAHRCSISIGAPTAYSVSDAGTNATGMVRRDVRVDDTDTDFADFLTDVVSEQALEEIGFDPQKQVIHMSANPVATGAGKTEEKNVRNPGLMEDRSLFLECGRRWQVGNYQDELKRRMEDSDIPAIGNYDARAARRSAVLGLSLTNPNELLEEVKGTLIDMFGNYMDINRNTFPGPSGTDQQVFFDSAMEKLRHTVAFHMELNTRKGWRYGEEYSNTKKPILLKDAPDPLSSSNNARDRSRWSVDVDKEGLTKVNIPATSETGNIPALVRYETSSVIEVDDEGHPTGKVRDDPTALYRNNANRDVFHDQFGPGGISILDDKEKPNITNRLAGNNSSWLDDANSQSTFPKYVQAGTAFHDITRTALTLLKENINIVASEMAEPDPPAPKEGHQAVSSEVDPRAPKADPTPASRDSETGLVSGQPNAGGRSIQANLDGSLEMSIGANTVDRVSLTLDTAGAIVSRLGRDRFGRSVIMHADGAIALEVGGFDFVGESASDTVDSRFVGRGDPRSASLPNDPTRYRSGKIVMRLCRANADASGPDPDNAVGLLVWDETGLTIHSAGRMNFTSDMDMMFKSDSRIIIDAPKIQMYQDPMPRYITRFPRRIM